MARHVGRLKLGSKPPQLYVRFCILPLSPQTNNVSSGIIRHYVAAFVCLHFCLTGYQSAQFVRRALHYASGSRKFLRQGAQPRGRRVYCHPQKDFFVISQLFSVVRHVGRFQVESFQRLKKWYLIPPCLTLSTIRHVSRVKWSNLGNGVAPSPAPRCCSYSKREPSGHPRLPLPTLQLYIYMNKLENFKHSISLLEGFFSNLCDVIRVRNFLFKIEISKQSCLPLVEGDPKASYSIATTPKCREGLYSFFLTAPLYP